MGAFRVGLLACAMQPLTAYAQTAPAPPLPVEGLSAAQVMGFAENAVAAGDFDAAMAAYRALENDPDPDVRAEARYRLGQLLAAKGQLAEAATLFRAILDEKPDAQRVRLELAAVLARMGKMEAAGRALRQAQAGGLPDDVARVVDQYAAALRSIRPYGASFELAFAPSTNINRATGATTLDTIIAPFELSEDARAKSGLGLRIGGQVFARLPVAKGLRLTARASTQANLYRERQFHDIVGSAQIGLESQQGKSRFRLFGGRSLRWFSGDLFASTNSLTAGVQHPAGKKAQIDVELGAGDSNYRINDQQDGRIYDFSATYERAFSARLGARLSLTAQRQTARDPGFATASGGINALVYAEAGKTTLFASAGVTRLEADARLLLFPERRREWLIRASAGATLRQIKVAGFSPLVRLSWERNASTVGLYDYRRLGGELGIVRAF